MHAKSLSTLFCLTCIISAAAQTTSQAAPPIPLSLRDAEQLALKNNPQITIARLLALAQHEVTREVRSTQLPTATGSLTAVEAHEGTRITAGALNNPSVLERAGGGVALSQLITDFGRSHNLAVAASYREKAQQDDQIATAADITLAVDRAFYTALSSQAELTVAQQTVSARQTTADQVSALTNAKLKSDLDLSFANVNLSQAKLLLLDAQGRHDAAIASLSQLLGDGSAGDYQLLDENQNSPAPPSDFPSLLQQALRARPDLAAANDLLFSQQRVARAEHDLLRPTISALGAAGGTPARADQITSSWYGAVGVNLSVPIFNGFLFSARAREADFKTGIAQQQVRDLRDRIARDVRITWLQANTAYQRMDVSEQLLKQANLALDLAQTRYKLGLSSIVELSQAQLQQTDAQIARADARYDYLATLAALNYQIAQ